MTSWCPRCGNVGFHSEACIAAASAERIAFKQGELDRWREGECADRVAEARALGCAEALAAVRAAVARRVKAHPDSSHGEDYTNHGIESALRIIDLAMDAPCVLRPTAYGQWCDLHSSPVTDENPLVDGRCSGYKFAAIDNLETP